MLFISLEPWFFFLFLFIFLLMWKWNPIGLPFSLLDTTEEKKKRGRRHLGCIAITLDILLNWIKGIYPPHGNRLCSVLVFNYSYETVKFENFLLLNWIFILTLTIDFVCSNWTIILHVTDSVGVSLCNSTVDARDNQDLVRHWWWSNYFMINLISNLMISGVLFMGSLKNYTGGNSTHSEIFFAYK